MLKRILEKLEDPKRPLLGPNVKALKFWGLLLPENKKLKYFYLTMHAAVTLCVITECIEVWFVKSNVKVLLQNLGITLVDTVSLCKIMTFLIRQKDWKNIINYVTTADLNQRDTEDKEKLTKIQYFTKYSRILTYTFWCLMYTTCIVCIITPIFQYGFSQKYRESVRNGTMPYTEVISSWAPFDKQTVKGYLAVSFYQSYVAIYGGGWITAFDAMALTIMVFFRAELELLRMDAAKLFEVKDKEEIKQRITSCHKRHIELVRFSRTYNSCQSPVMMFYIFLCAVLLCLTVYQLSIEASFTGKLISLQLIVFDMAQLFMYCWQSNQILFASQDLMLGPYESEWYGHDVIHRKDLIILTTQFQKCVVVSAGPFTDLTLATFISILKAAYSYYTILSTHGMNQVNPEDSNIN